MRLFEPATIVYSEMNSLFQTGRLIRIEQNGQVFFEEREVSPWIGLRVDERFLLDGGGHPVAGLHNGAHTCADCEQYQQGYCKKWHASVWHCWPSCSLHFKHKGS